MPRMACMARALWGHGLPTAHRPQSAPRQLTVYIIQTEPRFAFIACACCWLSNRKRCAPVTHRLHPALSCKTANSAQHTASWCILAAAYQTGRASPWQLTAYVTALVRLRQRVVPRIAKATLRACYLMLPRFTNVGLAYMLWAVARWVNWFTIVSSIYMLWGVA
eukprot:scaffold108952_cov17-Tisochrysis_lutea.AAC.1